MGRSVDLSGGGVVRSLCVSAVGFVQIIRVIGLGFAFLYLRSFSLPPSTLPSSSSSSFFQSGRINLKGVNWKIK